MVLLTFITCLLSFESPLVGSKIIVYQWKTLSSENGVKRGEGRAAYCFGKRHAISEAHAASRSSPTMTTMLNQTNLILQTLVSVFNIGGIQSPPPMFDIGNIPHFLPVGFKNSTETSELLLKSFFPSI
jgi:hypothetical protein